MAGGAGLLRQSAQVGDQLCGSAGVCLEELGLTRVHADCGVTCAGCRCEFVRVAAKGEIKSKVFTYDSPWLIEWHFLIPEDLTL